MKNMFVMDPGQMFSAGLAGFPLPPDYVFFFGFSNDEGCGVYGVFLCARSTEALVMYFSGTKK